MTDSKRRFQVVKFSSLHRGIRFYFNIKLCQNKFSFYNDKSYRRQSDDTYWYQLK